MNDGMLRSLALMDNGARAITTLLVVASPAQFAIADYFVQRDGESVGYRLSVGAIAAQAGVVLLGLLGVYVWKVASAGRASPMVAGGAAVAAAAAAYFLFVFDIAHPDLQDDNNPALGPYKELFAANVEQLRGQFALAVLAWVFVHAASPLLVHGSTIPFCCGAGGDEEEEHALVPPTAGRGGREHATHSERRRWLAAFLFAANVAFSTVIIVFGEPLSLAVRVLFTVWQAAALLLLACGCLLSFDARAARAGLQLAVLIGSGVTAAWIGAYQDAHADQLATDHPGKHYLVWPAHAANAALLFGLLYAVALGTLQFTRCGGISAPRRQGGEAAVALLGGDAGSGLGITTGVAPTYAAPSAPAGFPPVSANGVPRSHVSGYGF